MLVVDVAHIFRIFGGPKGVLTLLCTHQPDHGLTYNAVQMWNQRKKIPTKYIAAVFYCCERTGHACHEFFIDPNELS